jgi:diguanylate cyclase (GGDEF)-like protein
MGMKWLDKLPIGIMGKAAIVTCISAAATLAAIWYFSAKFTSYHDALLKERVVSDARVLNLYLDDIKQNSKSAAMSMAINADAIRAIGSGNKDEIIRVFEPCTGLYHVDFFTICDDKGNILARTHAHDSFGDSALNQRVVRDALNGRSTTCFVPSEVIKISARTGAPVRDASGRLIGAVSAGVRLDSDKAAARLKTLIECDAAIFLGNSVAASTLESELVGDLVFSFDLDEAKDVLEKGEEYFSATKIKDQTYKTYYKPLFDADNKFFATAFLSTPVSNLISQLRSLLFTGMAIAVIGIFISKCVMYLFFVSIKKRVASLSTKAELIANGQLDIPVGEYGRDEVGKLGGSLQKAISNIQSLFEEIFFMVSEHKKGNITYRIIMKNFQGQFQSLAESILDLTNLSVKDPLTGLLNRRNFYSSLVKTRARSIREAIPIGLLMIDIDNFVHVGFERGDEILKKVGSIISRAIIDEVDIVGRWGGDIFTVMLPDTTPNGAANVAERVRAKIEHAGLLASPDSDVKITVSIGTVSMVPTEAVTADDMIFRANKALRTAKDSGRNVAMPYKEAEQATPRYYSIKIAPPKGE